MATIFNPATAHYSFRGRAIPPASIPVTSPVSSSTALSLGVTPRPAKVLLSPSKSRQSNTDRNELHRAAAADVLKTLLRSSESAPSIQHTIVLRHIEQRTWELFGEQFGSHPSFEGSKWEYDDVNKKIISIPLPAPFHDFSVTVMGDHVHHGMRHTDVDTPARTRTLRVNRENMQKTTATGQSQREAGCTLYSTAYHSCIVATIVWESATLKNANSWCAAPKCGVGATMDMSAA